MEERVSCALGGFVRLNGSCDPKAWDFLDPSLYPDKGSTSHEHHQRLTQLQRWGLTPVCSDTLPMMQRLRDLQDEVLQCDSTAAADALLNPAPGWTYLWADDYKREIDQCRARLGLEPVAWATQPEDDELQPVEPSGRPSTSPLAALEAALETACHRAGALVKAGAKRVLDHVSASGRADTCCEVTGQQGSQKRPRPMMSLATPSQPLTADTGTAATRSSTPAPQTPEDTVLIETGTPEYVAGSPVSWDIFQPIDDDPILVASIQMPLMEGDTAGPAADGKPCSDELQTCSEGGAPVSHGGPQLPPLPMAQQRKPTQADEPPPGAAVASSGDAAVEATGSKVRGRKLMSAARTGLCWAVGLTAAWITFVFSTCDDEQC